MTVRAEAREEVGGGENGGVRRSRLDSPWLFVVAIGVLLLIFGEQFIRDPSLTAPTRDPAWYTWRAGIIVHSNPGLVPQDWGPFHMFGGGYRVSVPVIGALLQDIAGTEQSSFAAFMMIFIPILAGLAFGAGAYRSTKSPALYLLTMFVTGVFFLTTPYVGYLDNLFVLYVLGALIGFLEPARTSWGARSAVFLLALLAMFTHPTTCVVFLGTMFVVLGWHVLSMRFDFRAVLERDLPALLSVFAGMFFGVFVWLLGKLVLWGTPGNLADAALPPPYTRAFFMDRLMEWVRAQYPLVVIPLMVIAIVWIAQRARRDGQPADAYRTMIVWWLLPYAASVIFVVAGKVLPYYRFMNSTAAIMPLTALGIWVVGVWLMKKTNRNVIAAVLMLAVLVVGFRYAVVHGLETSRWNDPENQWIDQETRVSLASVQSIADAEPGRPVVFVNNYAREFQAYGWSKTYANVGRAGLRGDVAPRTFQYFGDLDAFLAGERTISNPDCDTLVGGEKEPDLAAVSKRPACTYDLISRGFLDEMNKGVEEHGGEPVVFMVRKFNTNSDNLKYFDEPASDMVSLGPDTLLVTGTGYVTPSPDAIDDAVTAGKTEAAYLADHPGPLADPLHLLRVFLGLAILFAVPGLIAARWFGLEGWQLKLGLVPAISLTLNILAAIVVIALTRSAFGPVNAWVAAVLAVVAAGGLHVLARRREKRGANKLARGIGGLGTKGGEMIDAMSVPFKEQKSFRALMLTQFISMAGDGVVAGTILTIVLSPQNAKTGRDLLALVFLTYLPFAIIAPFVGVLADRYDRRKLLVVANSARAVLMVLAVAMLLIDVAAVALLSALALLMLAGFRLMLLIKGAGLPDAVEGKDLLLANSLSQAGGTIFQAGGAIFAVAFGKIFKAVNPGFIAVVAIALYAIAAAFARRVDRLETGDFSESLGRALRGVVRNVAEGVKEIGRRPAAAIGILSFWFTRTLVFGFIGLSLSFAAFETLRGVKKAGGGASTEVIVSVVFAGIGAAIGLFYAQKVKDKRAPAKVISTFMFLAGGSAVLVPVTIAGRYLATFFAGLGFFLVKVSADTVTQRALPDDFRGRAYALFDISYALSYAIPAAVLFVAASAKIDLDWIVAAYGLVLVGVAAALGLWAAKLGLYKQVSDDLVGEQVATGVAE